MMLDTAQFEEAASDSISCCFARPCIHNTYNYVLENCDLCKYLYIILANIFPTFEWGSVDENDI